MGPLVSVVIPCWGQASLLPRAVESVVAQTWPAWECVIVDDGSPDDAADVARTLARRFRSRRIRVLEQPNSGVHVARNAAIEASRGELVVPLDADDRLAPELLELACQRFAEEPHLDLVYSDMVLFGAQRRTVRLPGFDQADLRRINTLPVTSVYRRELWQRVGGYHGSALGYEDWDFWLACLEQGLAAAHLPRGLFHYRVSAKGAFHRARRDRDALLKAQLVANHPPLFSTIQRRWSAEVLRHADHDPECPPLDGRSFAPACAIPNEGESLADLGSMAFWDGDTARAIGHWLASLRSADLSMPGRQGVLALADELGVAGKLRARARAAVA